MSGDGLIGQVGGALAGSPASLGVIPGGRGNDFARVVGIPDDVEAKERRSPTGVRGRSTSARSTAVALHRELRVRLRREPDRQPVADQAGRLVYAYAACGRRRMEAGPIYTTSTASGLSSGGYVANSRAYGGGMFIAPDAELDDGLLDVVWTGEVGKLRFLSRLPQVFDGAHVRNPEVTVSRAAEARVEADRLFAVYADGDHIADLPATVRILPGALRVIVPR